MEKKRSRGRRASPTDSSSSCSDQLKGGRLRWTAHDVMNLMSGVSHYGHAWSTIIKEYDFRGRNAKAISDKFYSIAGKGDRRTVYSKEEEDRLIQGVKKFGCRSWRRIAENGRCEAEGDDDQVKRLRFSESAYSSSTEQDSDDMRNCDVREGADDGETSSYDHEQAGFDRFQSLLLAVAADKISYQSERSNQLQHQYV